MSSAAFVGAVLAHRSRRRKRAAFAQVSPVGDRLVSEGVPAGRSSLRTNRVYLSTPAGNDRAPRRSQRRAAWYSLVFSNPAAAPGIADDTHAAIAEACIVTHSSSGKRWFSREGTSRHHRTGQSNMHHEANVDKP